MERETSTVKFFNNTTGFGFLIDPKSPGDDTPDIFVHYRSILGGEEYKTLREGQEVEFVRTKTDKGWQAAEVVPLAELK